MNTQHPKLLIIFLSSILLLTSGCAPLLVAGGTTAGVVANDERSTGSFVEDQEIELKILFQINEELGRQVNINATSYNRRVLLTGQTPTAALRKHVVNIVSSINNVKEVLNEIQLGNPSSLTSRAADSAVTAKVKTKLCSLQISGFSCLDVKVVTEQGIVYLMGLVTKSQEKIAVDTTRHVGGVLEVKTLFERAE